MQPKYLRKYLHYVLWSDLWMPFNDHFFALWMQDLQKNVLFFGIFVRPEQRRWSHPRHESQAIQSLPISSPLRQTWHVETADSRSCSYLRFTSANASSVKLSWINSISTLLSRIFEGSSARISSTFIFVSDGSFPVIHSTIAGEKQCKRFQLMRSRRLGQWCSQTAVLPSKWSNNHKASNKSTTKRVTFLNVKFRVFLWIIS